jgi:hypothetical protein
MAYGRDTHMRDTPMREMHAYERCTPMRARLWDGFCEKHAYKRCPYEMAAYEMVYGRGMLMRCTPTVRGTPMRWPMKDARLWETRLWDGFCEKHAYKRCVYEMAAYERRTYERCPYKRHAYEMAYGRCTPMRDKPMRWPVVDTCLWEKHAYERCMPMRWPMGEARL